MSHNHPISETFIKASNINPEDFNAAYDESIKNPEKFWAQKAQELCWIKPFSKAKNTSFSKNNVTIKWFEDGMLNVCANCIDRHLPTHHAKTALIWQGDNPSDTRHISYAELYDDVCKFANVLKDIGVEKGDRVTIYMPMIVEAVVAMLACARIGAVHSVVFGGFSPEALAGRIVDCKSLFIITADEGVRGAKTIPLKANVDAAIEIASGQGQAIETALVVRRTGAPINWNKSRDIWLHDALTRVSNICPPEPMNAEDPLFILYTSGSTGKPKGVLHTTAGYLLGASLTHKLVFDLKDNDIYWCTADVGWITGHSYIVYGPLANAATTVVFEGVPNYPDMSRFWQVVDQHKVTIFYTAPTAIRALMQAGDEPVKSTSRKSLRLLGTVGEPINPEAWEWYFRVVGEERCPIVDTWWQTETGAIMLSPWPGRTTLKPGAAMCPFFGIEPAIVDSEGHELQGEAEGNLVIKSSWPSQMRTVYGDHKRFEDTYFSAYPNVYFTGDGAKRDKDGDIWITGRVDDVINVSGHRIGTAEVESALVAHPAVCEAAVVGYPHEIKGQGLYCYVLLMQDEHETPELITALKNEVRKTIGPLATPDILHIANGLPKTRSGKIMRRILRKIASDDTENLGDTSTLADPNVVEALIRKHHKLTNTQSTSETD